MGRTLPSTESNPSPHLPLLLPASVALITTITLISALCASHNRKPRPQAPQPSSKSSSQHHDHHQPHSMKPGTEVEATHGPIGPTDLPGPPPAPRRKLSVSLSLKLPEGLSRVRTGRRESHQEKGGAAAEESVWMKTIILGEKCKVPEDGQGEEGVFDEKGNRQRNYHPRTPRSMPVSRTNSFINVEVVHV